MNNETQEKFKSEVLCIADSNWVLGHWYIICMLNGRELTDFTSIAGIAEEKLGHTRALFRYLEEELELPEFQLEFGRGADQLHSLASLDGAPLNWADFIITLYLADVALWRFSSTFKDGNHEVMASLVQKFGEECYFHQLCIDGWLQGFSDEEKAQAKEALKLRLPSTLAWFGSEAESSSDPLISEGIRKQSVWDARAVFVEDVLNKLSTVLGVSDKEVQEIIAASSTAVDPVQRRPAGSALPPRLWEHMIPTSADAEIARRPLAVSVTDNIDLFGNVKKDTTEPVFDK